MKEIKTTFTAYVKKVSKINCLFSSNSNSVIYLDYIISTDWKVKIKHMRIEISSDKVIAGLSIDDKIEFEALCSIKNDGNAEIRKPYNLRRAQGII